MRKMGSCYECPRCGFEKETVFHALISYPAAMAYWFASPLGLRCDSIQGDSFHDWFFSLKSKLDAQQLCIVGMISWCIWNNRNDVIHEKAISILGL